MSGSGSQSSGTQNVNNTSNSAFNTTGTSSSITNPNTTGIWNSANQNAAGMLGGSGLTDGQQQAENQLSAMATTMPMSWALNGVNGQIGNTIGSVTNGNIPGVSTGTAASYMQPYENTYANDVLNPTMAAFQNQTQMGQNALNASRDAGSAFGDRAANANAVYQNQQGLAAGQLAGQITGTGYQTALGAGQGDASNQLAASGANAQNYLTGTAQALTGQQLQSGNDVNINNLATQNAGQLYNESGGGLNNLLNLMGSNVSGFGSSTSGTQTEGVTGSGSQQGIVNGGSSSKGASIPFF